ncbi:hypothetical protein BKP64_02675 [Marinobacter salinus]|uniref:Uncharacterized protein n=1 Tax=Marinobacter salinus TaxID=1874317 RepID=A0A1D9GI12_9GAMM|nr:hypothetical protein [Marinobacter salinus]AOY87174.1 hypothetical protein BKP64_02675 [Marinobacter salinus]
MSLKDSLQGRLEKLAEEMVPQLLDTWHDVQKRLDDLNCSLAHRAVPERRRPNVSELALKHKAEQAGQGKAEVRPLRRNRKSGSIK